MLVANHSTFIDALVIAAACPRPTRYVMDHKRFNAPLINFIFRATRSIPIAPAKEDPVMLERAYDEIAKGLTEGDLICIFPEGGLTKDGEIQPFRAGIKRIIDRTPVPVVPVALRGLWRSFFGRQGGSVLVRLFRLGLFGRIGMTVGEPVAAQAVTPEGLLAIVARLRGDEK